MIVKMSVNTYKASLYTGLALFFISLQTYSQEYFQQRADYIINVALDDTQHSLKAVAELTYSNHSPDTLHFIYFHLYPNAYSGNHTALAKELMLERGRQKLFKDSDVAGSVTSVDFLIHSLSLNWSLDKENPDIALVYLSEPLLPGESVNITIPFAVKIPASGTSRMGHSGQSYLITQWYPKPAVYDKNGWHPMPYLDQGEFYSEFGDYVVNITLPENYRVGSSGSLETESEKRFMLQLAADTAWRSMPDLLVPETPPSSDTLKTIRFSAKNVHDFAWFADKRYHVLLDSIQLEPFGKVVYLTSLFTGRQSDLWKQSLEYVRDAMSYFSSRIGDYPYAQFTLVQGQMRSIAGMEYPGAAVIGFAKDDYSLCEVVVHELLHSWFYGALGSNERAFPYQDESLTSALESNYIAQLYPDIKLWPNFILKEKTARFFKLDQLPLSLIPELNFVTVLNNNLEQPLNLPADKYSEPGYFMVYVKGAKAFNYLRAYLGDDVFFEGLNLYFVRWKHKHPDPEALRQAFEAVTPKNLDWFFEDVVSTTKRLDYSLADYKNGSVLIKNKGDLNGPLLLSGFEGDSLVFDTWVDGFKAKKWIEVPDAEFDRLVIDPEYRMIESKRLNNNLYTEGLFRKRDPLKTQLIATVNRPDERLLLYFPAINYTKINGFMPGIGIQNHLIIPRQFEFIVLPFYSFKTDELTGYINTKLSLLPRRQGRKVNINLAASRFGAPGGQNYHRINLGADYTVIPDLARLKDNFHYFASLTYASDLQKIMQDQKTVWIPVLAGGVEIIKNAKLHPYSILIAAEGNSDYSKASVTVNYRYSYYGKNKGLDVRFFSGLRMHLDNDKLLFGLSPSARSGRELYTYQGSYFDRFAEVGESFFSRQSSITEGGLITPTDKLWSNPQWLFSLTLSSSLPINVRVLNIQPFATIALVEQGTSKRPDPAMLGEAGLKTGFGQFFELYVPLLITNNFLPVKPKLKDRIRFTLNLDFLSRIGEVL